MCPPFEKKMLWFLSLLGDTFFHDPASLSGSAMQSRCASRGVQRSKKAKPTKKAKQVTCVEETSQQVVYGFSNLTPAQASPEAIATFLRDHWAIENRLHWRRDVTLREDHSQVRTSGKPEVLSALNNVVLALMDWLGVRNVPDQMRIFAAFPTLALDLLLGPLTFE
jgi:predicted transposase YbfD/YdcC